MCCDNPIELTCQSSCDEIVLPVVVLSTAKIYTTFNGVKLPIEFSINSSNYAVIDRRSLNEDYNYTFGVYNAANTQIGCYKLDIKPSATCCTSTFEGDKIIQDVCALNSNVFLDILITEGGTYGYEMTGITFDGVALPDSERQSYISMDVIDIPVQAAPFDTIAEHDEDNKPTKWLTYDNNLISFLSSTPIAAYMDFKVTPFGAQKDDRGYPLSIVETLTIDITDIQTEIVYGQGFQQVFPENSRFTFTLKHYYNGLLWHQLTYTERGYTVDGGFVYPQNRRLTRYV